ncbi:hypothetical protein BDZ94DRAFT_1001647 [Collybia nuda]|uniref:Uncharacterized protein n=1 Tax=Collybia nuda TaxID=64659 RepID=A0A9P5Y1K2_9AGAR|nr:hypothetical protein BDZ94DRAFT_1001647 [Collybia nuda]
MCTISVVLDAGAHKFFSGIRIIIVYERSERLRDTRIEDRIGPNERENYHVSAVYKPRISNTTYRASLERHQTLSENSKAILAHHSSLDGNNTTLPLCTVVFEFLDNSDDIGPSVGLKLRLDSISKAFLHIIYERATTCTPDRRAFVSHLQLTSNHYFRRLINPDYPSVPTYPRPRSMPTHMVRVLPLSGSAPIFLQLPLTILRRIATFAFSRRESGFRRGLLSFGLICKAWLPVLDIFFEILGHPNYHSRIKDLPSAAAAARTLECKPEKAKFLKIFRSRDYFIDDDEDNLAGAHISILKLATFITDITISSVPPSLVDPFLNTASMLKAVRNFTVSTQDDMGSSSSTISKKSSPQLRISDILNLISHWEELRTLIIIQSQSSNNSDVEYINGHLNTLAQSYSCKIEGLNLSHVTISGPQILRLISPSHPILTGLSLDNISGVSNREFLSFLSYASPTLVHLHISSSNIPRDSDAEEYAVDAVMPLMVALNGATISGQASILAIARKSRSKVPKPINSLQSLYSMNTSVTFTDNTYDPSASDVAAALQTTGWRSITISYASGNVGPNTWDASSREMVIQVAKERGLRLITH